MGEVLLVVVVGFGCRLRMPMAARLLAFPCFACPQRQCRAEQPACIRAGLDWPELLGCGGAGGVWGLIM